MELKQRILLHTEKTQNDGGWRAYPLNFPSEFSDAGWMVLDQHIAHARNEGFINARKTNAGWEVYSLTIKGMEALEPTQVDALWELVETIRQASERAETVARRANRIAWYAVLASLLCALTAILSQPFIREFWGQVFG